MKYHVSFSFNDGYDRKYIGVTSIEIIIEATDQFKACSEAFDKVKAITDGKEPKSFNARKVEACN